MKAPKFAVWVDHFTKYNYLDRKFSLSASTVLDAMAETLDLLSIDGNVYCTHIYQLVPNTKGTKYKAILRCDMDCGFKPVKSDLYMERTRFQGLERYTII